MIINLNSIRLILIYFAYQISQGEVFSEWCTYFPIWHCTGQIGDKTLHQRGHAAPKGGPLIVQDTWNNHMKQPSDDDDDDDGGGGGDDGDDDDDVIYRFTLASYVYT